MPITKACTVGFNFRWTQTKVTDKLYETIITIHLGNVFSHLVPLGSHHAVFAHVLRTVDVTARRKLACLPIENTLHAFEQSSFAIFVIGITK